MGRNIISSHVFWKYRHIFLSEWWKHNPKLNNIKKDYTFYLNLTKKYKINSILDFGCAGAPLLYELKSKNKNILTYGIDISKEAVKSNKEIFSKNFMDTEFFFSEKVEKKEIKNFLIYHKIKYFDLIVFDRVLYCLSDLQLENTLIALREHGKLIFIEDFYKLEDNGRVIGYRHRNWTTLLKAHGFKQLYCKNTIYSSIQHANPKSALFQNVNISI